VTAEAALRSDLWALLEEPAPPKTWIVVSHAAWLPNLFRRARDRGIRVLLWPGSADQVPSLARAEADGSVPLSWALRSEGWAQESEMGSADGSAPAPSGRELSPTSRTSRRPDGQANGAADGARDGDRDLPDEESPNGKTRGTGGRLDPWVRLVYHVEGALRRNAGGRVAFQTLAGALAELEDFGPTPANALMWLDQARAEGLLLADEEPHPGGHEARVPRCRPNLEHPVARLAVEAPDRCLRLLNQMLQKMPWVSFKLLRSVLLREQWLGGPPLRLDEEGVDEWLNFLIQDEALSMTKEPNLVNPEHPVTALRLNEEHPRVRTVVAEGIKGTRLAVERAILAVDHFLTRNRKPWMSISALRRALEDLPREELQEVLQGLQTLGALVTESYPNPQKEHPTTGCRLKPDDPIVVEALSIRNSIIRTTQHHQRLRNWVPVAGLEEELRARHGTKASPPHHLAWFLLLRDEGILELDHDGPVPDGAWEAVRCRLNVSDAVVRTVVAEGPDGCGITGRVEERICTLVAGGRESDGGGTARANPGAEAVL
jgi:hypothetical protein